MDKHCTCKIAVNRSFNLVLDFNFQDQILMPY